LQLFIKKYEAQAGHGRRADALPVSFFGPYDGEPQGGSTRLANLLDDKFNSTYEAFKAIDLDNKGCVTEFDF